MFVIPQNNPVLEVQGVLVNVNRTSSLKASIIAQVLFREAHMGIDNKVHVLDCWNPENGEELLKLAGALEKGQAMPCTVPVRKGMRDDEVYNFSKAGKIIVHKTN